MVTSCSKKKQPLLSLDVEKHECAHHAIVVGEANGGLVKKLLKKLDKCNHVWSNSEMNNVSESVGLISATLPFLAVTTVGSAISNALLKPLGRAVGFKGLRCKKRKHEEEECESEHESEHEPTAGESCQTPANDRQRPIVHFHGQGRTGCVRGANARIKKKFCAFIL